MSYNLLNEEAVKCLTKIDKHKKKLAEIQENCMHPESVLYYTNFSNTGDYDPSEDSYWSVYDCKCCGKIWNDDQGKFKGIKNK